MKYWIFKSEPSTYSIDDMMRDVTTYWNGVRNYQARNFLRDDVKIGDQVLFYHSSCEVPAVVGLCEVVKNGYPDFTAFEPKSEYFDPKSKIDEPTWFMVDIKFVKKFRNPVTLQNIKSNPKLRNLKLVQKGNRLSIIPITKDEFDEILKMAFE